MQKLTIFSIILSLSVLLILGDIVYHDYLDPVYSTPPADDTEDYQPLMQDYLKDIQETDGTYDAEDGFKATGSEDADSTESAEGSESADSDEMAYIHLTEDSTISLLTASISEDAFTVGGFFDPILKDTIFSGYVFNFLKFSDQVEPFVYQWNLFDGEEFVGAIYEMRYPTATGSFQGYLTLRERAEDLSDLGAMNEVNLYGDSSFYFNHITKTKTVHMVMRRGADVYAFEYAYAHHDKMKKVFELL